MLYLELDPYADNTSPSLTEQYMCTQCRTVMSGRISSCSSCGCASLIPYLDKRPLLLSSEAHQAIQELIDQIGDRINDVDCSLDEQLYYSGDLLPFLARVLDDSELAARRRETGNFGYRTTTLSPAGIVSHLRDLRFPPAG